jgi:hypothetical protein
VHATYTARASGKGVGDGVEGSGEKGKRVVRRFEKHHYGTLLDNFAKNDKPSDEELQTIAQQLG